MDELAEAEARLKRKLESDEARYFAYKIGHSIVRYTQFWRQAFTLLVDPLDQRIDALNSRLCALEESDKLKSEALEKARAAYADLKRQGGQK